VGLINRYIKILFVELIKLVYDELRIHRDIPQGKLAVIFETSPGAVYNEMLRLF
jgi:hypothetical protein